MQRFHLSDLSTSSIGAIRTLSEEEAHHLRDVLRIGAGDEVDVFDGAGWSSRAAVSQIDRRGVTVTLATTPRLQWRRSPELWFAVSPPKGDRFRWLVEKCTELDVTRIVPLLTRRTVVTPGEGKWSKLAAAVAQACKQCGRDWWMEVADSLAWEEFWRFLEAESPVMSTQLLIADQHGKPLGAALRAEREGRSTGLQRRVVLIGPEGGFTSGELSEAEQRGASRVSLGRYTLRVETAVVVAAALCRAGDDPEQEGGGQDF
jgi:16S rRNA (uracil1498-N3)-methyltransferase